MNLLLWLILMSKILHGENALKEVESLLGVSRQEMPVGMALLVKHEGYSEEPYRDDKGVLTVGVGQTGVYASMPFPMVYERFHKLAQRYTPNLKELPEEAQGAILLATYRGTWGQSPKTRRLFSQGEYKEAAKEFLNNEEYLSRKKKGGDGVTKRMEYIASVLKSLEKEET